MKILIDGYNLALAQGTGVATYARNLNYNLRRLGHQTGILYGQPSCRTRNPLLNEIQFFDVPVRPFGGRLGTDLSRLIRAARAPAGFTAHEIRIEGRVVSPPSDGRLPEHDSLWNVPDLFHLAHSCFARFGTFLKIRVPWQPDVVHWTYPLPIKVLGAANIYTIHDLVPLRLPYTTLDDKRFHLRMMEEIGRTADQIVTISEHSRSDIIDLLGIDASRVTTTYLSVTVPATLMEKPVEQVAQEVKGLTGLDYGEYFLFWGAIEPKKNVGRLVEGYLAANTSTPLLIVGPEAWLAEDELRLLNQHRTTALGVSDGSGSSGTLVKLDYMPFVRLISLIRGAKALLFPSIYEGFGLPILEAMMCGTPVLTSAESSCPEVAGDAAVLVDPYDVDDIRKGIIRLDTDDALRNELRSKGAARAADFSEEIYRQRLTEVYERLT